MKQFTLFFLLALLAVILTTGCGTTVGNGMVNLASKPFNPVVMNRLPLPWKALDLILPRAFAGTISSLKFCSTKIKLDAPDGTAIAENSATEFEAQLGLVDLGDGTRNVAWGSAKVPPNALISRFRIEIHQDSSTCGVPYSMSANGQTITKDKEFQFTFATPHTVVDGTTINFTMANLVAIIEQALAANAFNDASIDAYFDPTDSQKSGEDKAD